MFASPHFCLNVSPPHCYKPFAIINTEIICAEHILVLHCSGHLRIGAPIAGQPDSRMGYKNEPSGDQTVATEFLSYNLHHTLYAQKN